MPNSPRRNIVYPDLLRIDPADVPRFIKYILDAVDVDVVYGQGLYADIPVGHLEGRFYYVISGAHIGELYYDDGTGWHLIGSVADGSITAAKIADTLKPSLGAADGVEALRALGTAAGKALPGNHASVTDARVPLNHASTHDPGGPDPILNLVPTGVLLPYGGDVAPTGFHLCDGASYVRAAEAALFAIIGIKFGFVDAAHFNVPDTRGRGLIGKGSNVVVDTLGKNDGVTEANRRGTKHQHTVHTHGGAVGRLGLAGTGYLQSMVGGDIDLQGTIINHDGGSGVVTDPVDGGAFLVINHIIKA